MKTLVTWTDRAAPSTSYRDRNRSVGPVKMLLQDPKTAFEGVLLLSTPEVILGARELGAELKQLGFAVQLHILELSKESPYEDWYVSVGRVLLDQGMSECDGLISAGSPQARAVWLALLASGRFRGQLYQVKQGQVRVVRLPSPPEVSAPDPQIQLTEFGSLTLREAVFATEKQVILATLAETENNVLQTARRLGIDRNTLKRKLKQMGVRN